MTTGSRSMCAQSILERTLVVVPARGGSKRIPKKNIRTIAGRPMIGWPLSVIKEIFSTDRVLLSTDSEEIASVALSYGVGAGFTRPAHLADDFATTMDVVRHALAWHEAEVGRIDYVLTIYPTAVLLRGSDLIEASRLLESDKTVPCVFSATEYAYPIQRALYLDPAQRAQMFMPEHSTTRSQDLQPAYHDAGQFYYCRSELVRQGGNLIGDGARIVNLPRWRVVDIDTEDDFALAEMILKSSGVEQ